MSNLFDLSKIETAAVAYWLSFSRLFPLILIMIHYTVIATYISESNCDQTNLPNFFVYWSIMMILSFIWGLVMHLHIYIPDIKRRIAYCTWTGCLSSLLFMSWSFIRAKPFKCLNDGDSFVYVAGPVVFWVVHLVALISTGIFVSRYKSNKLRQFIRFDDSDVTLPN